MGHAENTVFISYRRMNLPWALGIYQDLTHHGYNVFFEYHNVTSSDFEKIILDNIKARAHFIVVLTASALERCKEPNDLLRREIETAIDQKRHIVPLMVGGFDYGNPLVTHTLTGKLATLSSKNGLPLYAAYFFEGMEKLRNQYLNILLNDVPLQPLSTDVQKLTELHTTAAREVPLVEEQQLTAQEWFERGYVPYEGKSYDEAIHCFTKAIRLKQDFSEVYYFYRGSAHNKKGDKDSAIKDYTEAIRIKPDYATAYYNRGIARSDQGDMDRAIKDYDETIRLKPNDAAAYYNRGLLFSTKGDNLSALSDFQKASEWNPNRGSYRSSFARTLKSLRRFEEAKQQEQIARKLIQKESEYDQACFEATCGNTEKALELLKTALKKNQPRAGKAWARQDPDLENVRNDPRFKELVGE